MRLRVTARRIFFFARIVPILGFAYSLVVESKTKCSVTLLYCLELKSLSKSFLPRKGLIIDKDQALSSFLPFARLLLITARPPLVFMRARKPCVLLRLRLLG